MKGKKGEGRYRRERGEGNIGNYKGNDGFGKRGREESTERYQNRLDRSEKSSRSSRNSVSSTLSKNSSSRSESEKNSEFDIKKKKKLKIFNLKKNKYLRIEEDDIDVVSSFLNSKLKSKNDYEKKNKFHKETIRTPIKNLNQRTKIAKTPNRTNRRRAPSDEFDNLGSFAPKGRNRSMNRARNSSLMDSDRKRHNAGELGAIDWVEDNQWLEGAVECKEKRHSKIVGDKEVTRIVRLYYMEDGSIEIIENLEKKLLD